MNSRQKDDWQRRCVCSGRDETECGHRRGARGNHLLREIDIKHYSQNLVCLCVFVFGAVINNTRVSFPTDIVTMFTFKTLTCTRVIQCRRNLCNNIFKVRSDNINKTECNINHKYLIVLTFFTTYVWISDGMYVCTFPRELTYIFPTS